MIIVVFGVNKINIYGNTRTYDYVIRRELNIIEGDPINETKIKEVKKTLNQIAFFKNIDVSTSDNDDNTKDLNINVEETQTGSFNVGLSVGTLDGVSVGYELKDYIITNSSTVSDSIDKSSGESIAFNIKNELVYNNLNSFIRPSNGNYLSFSNYIQTPSSSHNGYLKNVLSFKKYHQINKNVYSFQTKMGNINSLNNIEILSDDKFSLGGRWLRGFDNFGAGPRNSRTDYVGGNNIIVTKLDYSRPLTLNEKNPIYLNIFNDYGLVWGNKDKITFSDNQIRSSYGFGINFYSAIGPIGFSWGFPLSDKDYDIKRMFMFTIGNLN